MPEHRRFSCAEQRVALQPLAASYCVGAGDRGRTDTVSPPRDFESRTSANSITPALRQTVYHTRAKKARLFCKSTGECKIFMIQAKKLCHTPCIRLGFLLYYLVYDFIYHPNPHLESVVIGAKLMSRDISALSERETAFLKRIRNRNKRG